MGDQEVHGTTDGERRRRFARAVLDDLAALERMIAEGRIETDRRRIGAEQELVLVDERLRPSPVALELLERVDDPRITTEIARFNLEFNCDPIDCAGSALSKLRAQMDELMGVVGAAAREVGARPLLTGICPTLKLGDLDREFIVPKERYLALDAELRALRGAEFELRIRGTDELQLRHNSVMLEALNTSFQVHLQVTPDEFGDAYNMAQAIAAPQLASAVNSPVLFGKRLWRETRIAIFQQVVDSRGETPHGRDVIARVRFGERWSRGSVLDVLRHDVVHFRPILAGNVEEDSLAVLDAGDVPKLRALQVFNSTVYRWNRPCYGTTDGKPHLRIENRVLPAGPTVLDAVANAAFWVGLVIEGPHAFPDLVERLDFDDARDNFIAAARNGLASLLTWLDGEVLPAGELILDRLLPVARAGLARAGFDAEESDRACECIERRVAGGLTGANWTLRSIAAMRGRGAREERLHRLVRSMLDGMDSGTPVHEWPLARMDDEFDWRVSYATVGQCMSTELYTVGEDDPLDLAASIMDWERVRHVPVEDARHRLVGIVSYRRVMRAMCGRAGHADDPIAVSAVMVRDPITVSADTPTIEAIELMHAHGVSCLPVVDGERLVGIVSERDYAQIARELLERTLREGGPTA